MFARQLFEHGRLDNLTRPVKPVDITGGQVTLHDAPILGSEFSDDGVVGFVRQVVSMRGFAACQERGVFGLDRRHRHLQPDRAVERAAITRSVWLVRYLPVVIS